MQDTSRSGRNFSLCCEGIRRKSPPMAWLDASTWGLLGCLSKHDFDDCENVISSVTSRFCNNFTIILNPYPSKTYSKGPSIKCASAMRRIKRENWKFVITYSRRLRNCKTGYFPSWKGWERQWNVRKWNNAGANRAKLPFFFMTFLSLSLSCLRRLPNTYVVVDKFYPSNAHFITWEEVKGGLIHYFPIFHNALSLPPKFCINFCCEILLGGLHIPKSIPQK